MKKSLIYLISLIIILVVGFIVFNKGPEAQAPQPTATSTPAESQPAADGVANPDIPEAEAPAAANTFTVVYSDSGYSPSVLTVKKGDTVVFENQSSQSVWTASDIHPIHSAYSGSSLNEHCPDPANASFDACRVYAPGESWSFTFNKVGSWQYHNHVFAAHAGTVVVEE